MVTQRRLFLFYAYISGSSLRLHEIHLLLSLEVVQKNRSFLRLLAPILDNNARTINNLSGISITINLAKPGPLAQLLPVRNLDQRDLVLAAQGHNELLVRFLLAILIEHAHVRLSPIERLGSLAEPAREPIVHERDFQDSLEGVEDAELALGGGGAGYFDFFSVRLWVMLVT